MVLLVLLVLLDLLDLLVEGGAARGGDA
ncbi:MAG: hypothetical protein ACI9D0_001574 [Bacteroidia bacterium]